MYAMPKDYPQPRLTGDRVTVVFNKVRLYVFIDHGQLVDVTAPGDLCPMQDQYTQAEVDTIAKRARRWLAKHH